MKIHLNLMIDLRWFQSKSDRQLKESNSPELNTYDGCSKVICGYKCAKLSAFCNQTQPKACHPDMHQNPLVKPQQFHKERPDIASEEKEAEDLKKVYRHL